MLGVASAQDMQEMLLTAQGKDVAYLQFALAKAFDDCKQYDK